MNAAELISCFLRLIDNLNGPSLEPEKPRLTSVISVSPPDAQLNGSASPDYSNDNSDDIRRFRQIIDLINASEKNYSNEPQEAYADINAVTVNAGGGLNGPKDPSDIKGTTISLYPYYQNKPEG